MQPKRDPDDIRYWPQSEGGTGFNRDGKPRYQYSAITKKERTDKLASIVDEASKYSPDTVKSRARAALLLAIEQAHTKLSEDNTLTLNEISQSVNSLGRISGLADEEKEGIVTIRVVRDDAQPLPALPASAALVPHTLDTQDAEILEVYPHPEAPRSE